MLNFIHYPAAISTASPPLLIVHGLYGSARNWNVIAKNMSQTRDVFAVDLRNHGHSPWHDSHRYPDLAEDLAGFMMQHGGHFDVMGHSMGGKAAMTLSLQYPELVNRLIVADIAPVAYDHDQSQYIPAMRALNVQGLTTRSEADRRLSAHIDSPALRAFFLQSLDLKAENGPKWRLNLDVLERDMPHIVGWHYPAGQFAKPALFITGANSTYVQPRHHPLIKAQFPKAHFIKLSNAGHWLHADQPRAFEQTLNMFLGHMAE